jgi:hypothetical protein
VTTNLWTVGQGLITRQLVARTKAQASAGPKRSSRAQSKDQADGDAVEADAPAQKERPTQPAHQPAQPRRVKRKKRARR